jgi:hypothetical protein
VNAILTAKTTIGSSARYVRSHWLLSNWRLRTATALVGILVIANVATLASYRMTEEEKPALAGQVAEADQMLHEMQASRDPVALRTAIAETDSKLASGADLIPSSFKEADLLGAVMMAAEESGAKIERLQAGDGSEEAIGERSYRVQRYHAEVKGDLQSLMNMLTLMEKALPPSAVVENIILEPVDGGWSFSFDLLAYARA